jgi:protein phosphatase
MPGTATDWDVMLGSVAETKLSPALAAPNRRSVLDYAARTHKGRVRANNEDQYLICRLRKSLEVLGTSLPGAGASSTAQRDGYVFLVADGMGGAAAGEHASATAVEGVKRYLMQKVKWFFNLDDPEESVRVRQLQESLEQLDREMVAEGDRNPALAGMGTTLTAASVVNDEVFIVHVGDSRVYLFRDGRLEQLTHDHTVAQQLVQAGVIGPEEAKSHRTRHVLTNVVGGPLGVKGEIVKLRLGHGDRLLLCSDGLNDMVADERIADVLRTHPRAAAACDALIEEALRNGGRDNVTVVIADHTRTA